MDLGNIRPLTGTSNSEAIDLELAMDRMGYPEATRETIRPLYRRHVAGDYNGPLLEGGITGGVTGGFQWIFSFVQQLAQLLGGGTGLQDAFSQAASNASNNQTGYSAIQGLARLNFAMHEAGIPGADEFTGVSQGGSFTGTDREWSLMRQITAANNITDFDTRLNLNPEYRRPDRIATETPILADASGDSSIIQPPPATPSAPAQQSAVALNA